MNSGNASKVDFKSSKYVIIFIFTLVFVLSACSDDNGGGVIGDKCDYYSDCKGDEICLNKECIPSSSYDCSDSKNTCPLDLKCSIVSGKCKPASCNNHDECSAQQFCNGNVCKTGCINNNECGENYDCNPSSKTCEIKLDATCSTNPELCTDSQICNENGVCVEKTLDDGCASDWECDIDHGEICKIIEGQKNECIRDPNYCEDVSECPVPNSDYKCINHKCHFVERQDCSIDDECNGDRCDPSDGKCVQCYEDIHCEGSTCNQETKTCIIIRTCEDDSTCPEGTKCVMPDGIMPGMPDIPGGGLPGETGEGTCKEVDSCYIDADCNPEGTSEADTRYCKVDQGENQGYCASENNFNEDDLFGNIGDMIGLCVPSILPCSNGGECVNFKCEGGGGSSCSGPLGGMTCTSNGGECIDGVCQGEVEPECSRDSECASLYPDRENQICQRGGCIDDPTPRCVTDTECNTETMHMFCDTNENICYSCVTNDHCNSGATCRDHNCVNSSFCSSDSDCDGGQCVANLCQ